MKKAFLILLVAVTASWTASAQVVSYGAKLGLSFPGFQDEMIASERITPAITILGNLHISRSFVMQLEAGYELKGNKFTYEAWDNQGNLIEDSVYTERTNLGYFTVPLFLKLNIGRANKFYFQAGGFYGKLLHSGFSGMMNNELVSKVQIKPGLSPNDYGILIGGGLETPVRRGLSMLLDVKYNYGLKDINLDPAVTGKSGPMKTRNFLMSMGVVIDLE